MFTKKFKYKNENRSKNQYWKKTRVIWEKPMMAYFKKKTCLTCCFGYFLILF